MESLNLHLSPSQPESQYTRCFDNERTSSQGVRMDLHLTATPQPSDHTVLMSDFHPPGCPIPESPSPPPNRTGCSMPLPLTPDSQADVHTPCTPPPMDTRDQLEFKYHTPPAQSRGQQTSQESTQLISQHEIEPSPPPVRHDPHDCEHGHSIGTTEDEDMKDVGTPPPEPQNDGIPSSPIQQQGVEEELHSQPPSSSTRVIPSSLPDENVKTPTSCYSQLTLTLGDTAPRQTSASHRQEGSPTFEEREEDDDGPTPSVVAKKLSYSDRDQDLEREKERQSRCISSDNNRSPIAIPPTVTTGSNAENLSLIPNTTLTLETVGVDNERVIPCSQQEASEEDDDDTMTVLQRMSKANKRRLGGSSVSGSSHSSVDGNNSQPIITINSNTSSSHNHHDNPEPEKEDGGDDHTEEDAKDDSATPWKKQKQNWPHVEVSNSNGSYTPAGTPPSQSIRCRSSSDSASSSSSEDKRETRSSRRLKQTHCRKPDIIQQDGTVLKNNTSTTPEGSPPTIRRSTRKRKRIETDGENQHAKPDAHIHKFPFKSPTSVNSSSSSSPGITTLFQNVWFVLTHMQATKIVPQSSRSRPHTTPTHQPPKPSTANTNASKWQQAGWYTAEHRKVVGSATAGNQLVNKLKGLVGKCGGSIHNDVKQVDAELGKLKQVVSSRIRGVILSDGHHTTTNYLCGLAMGFLPLHFSWAIHCISAGAIIHPAQYLLVQYPDFLLPPPLPPPSSDKSPTRNKKQKLKGGTAGGGGGGCAARTVNVTCLPTIKPKHKRLLHGYKIGTITHTKVFADFIIQLINLLGGIPKELDCKQHVPHEDGIIINIPHINIVEDNFPNWDQTFGNIITRDCFVVHHQWLIHSCVNNEILPCTSQYATPHHKNPLCNRPAPETPSDATKKSTAPRSSSKRRSLLPTTDDFTAEDEGLPFAIICNGTKCKVGDNVNITDTHGNHQMGKVVFINQPKHQSDITMNVQLYQKVPKGKQNNPDCKEVKHTQTIAYDVPTCSVLSMVNIFPYEEFHNNTFFYQTSP